MTFDRRFAVNEDGYIIDKLNPANTTKGQWFEGDPDDDMHLREKVLWARLGILFDDLIINKNAMERFAPTGEEYQPHCQERFPIFWASFKAIQASHLNTLDVALSCRYKFDGELKREKPGWQDVTSLSLFADDVERLLRDLYGERDNEAIDRIRSAVFVIVAQFTNYLREDLAIEHGDAAAFDYACGIGVPDGCGISGSDCRRSQRAARDLEQRAHAVRANPTAFSKYTVAFVDDMFANWKRLARPIARSDETVTAVAGNDQIGQSGSELSNKINYEYVDDECRIPV
jgi:hypothetical protein